LSKEIVLKDAFKGYTLDQDKILTPEETVRRFKDRLQEVDGDILEKTVRIDNGRLDIPVFFSVCGRDAEQIIGTKKQMGKGGTPAQAEASAVMELAERYSFFSFSKNPGNFFIEKPKNLKEETLPFEAIAKSVHDNSDELEKSRRIFSELPLKWTRGYNLTKGKEVLIPFDWFFAINEFNGPSAGNCVEEAISQGICELVERHVCSIVSRGEIRAPAINPDSVTDPLVLEMLGKYQKAGVKLFISDLSFNTGIPTVGVLGYDPSTFPEKSELVWTAGTTPDPQKALSRALTEVAQLAGDFNSGSNYVASGLPKFRELSGADFVMQPESTVDIGSLPNLSHENIRVEVENCVSALEKNHLDVLLIDVMHPKLQIPAFYTIIPGAYFRERAVGTSVGMFSAKLVSENENPMWALAQLEKMDRVLPGRYYMKFYKGLIYLSVQEYGKGLGEFDEALRLDPKEEDIPSIYSYMGVCLKELEQYKRAIEVLRKAEEHDDERTDVYNLLGFCFYKLKEHEKAIECFQKVLKLDPSSAIDYANIASNYRDMGNQGMAIRYYKFALELDESIDFARENLHKLETEEG